MKGDRVSEKQIARLLLGDLEAKEAKTIQREIESDPEAAKRLEGMEATLEALKDWCRSHESLPQPTIPSPAEKKPAKRQVVRFRRWPAWAAAAAALLLLCGTWWLTTRQTKTPHVDIESALTGDIDGNGAVDIVDAYLMARRLKTNRDIPRDWDFNADGNVDSKDVEMIVRKAVAVKQEDI